MQEPWPNLGGIFRMFPSDCFSPAALQKKVRSIPLPLFCTASQCLPQNLNPPRSPIFSAIQTNLANLLGSLPTWIPSLTNSMFPRTWTTSSISNHRNHYWTKCWRSMYCLNCLRTGTKTSSEVLNWTMNLRHPQLHETGGKHRTIWANMDFK